MITVSYGGGTNSTALLVGLKERGIRPDCITFADTGGEKPHTYDYLSIMSSWCADNDFPEIVTVRNGGAGETLEDNCLRRKALPSIAYGFKTCSQRWKLQPQEKYFNNLAEAKSVWSSGDKIVRAVGFDADEPQRAREYQDDKYENRYYLIDWDWGRQECIDAIKRVGLPLPGKSACFFCPSSKPSEIKWLALQHPELMDRAIAIESGAELTQVAGLGRSFRWQDVIATDDMFPESFIDQACGCYDG